MSYCLNLDCPQPQNRNRQTFCGACGQPLSLKDRYRVLQPIGQGGFGRTFLGRDLHFPQTPKCVIKQLSFQSDNQATQTKVTSLFEQEAVRLSQLGQHPQIPALLAYFEAGGQLYLVQEYIEGRSLNPKRWSRSRQAGEQIERLLESLLPVLQFIHERQIIHRDIKPENIMLRRADRQFVLIDFGVARVLSQTALIGGATVIGTPGFMAPEQMRGKVLPASDLYSLGATCLNLLTNIDPDELFDVVNERWRWRDRLPPQTQLRPEVVGVINQLVAPSLRQRAQSAIVMLRQLGVAAHPSSRSPTASPAASFASVNPSEVDENQPTAIGGTNDPANDPSLKKTAISDQPTVVSGTAAEQPAPLSSQPEREAGPAIQIDYTGLKTALMRKRWRSADDATRDILCQLCGKASGGYLFPNDLAQLPCADLRAIDFLWRKYSEDHFGLAIQMQIYQAAQADYAQFCAQVGWPMHNPNNHNYLRYQLKAPPGHLPSRKWMGGSQGWKQAEQFDKKLAACLR